jgi:CO/xanthine dehydrogenase Mo-binding subunit
MVSAYRGAGRPEGNYYMERLIDRAAEEMGIDRLALRRRNQISRARSPTRHHPACSTTAAISRRCSTRQSRSPT